MSGPKVVGIRGAEVPTAPVYDAAAELRAPADRVESGDLQGLETGLVVLSLNERLAISVIGEPLRLREVLGLLEMAKLGAAIE